jgi:hypothetical protein
MIPVPFFSGVASRGGVRCCAPKVPGAPGEEVIDLQRENGRADKQREHHHNRAPRSSNSCLSATIGSTRTARRAGTQQARTANQ